MDSFLKIGAYLTSKTKKKKKILAVFTVRNKIRKKVK